MNARPTSLDAKSCSGSDHSQTDHRASLSVFRQCVCHCRRFSATLSRRILETRQVTQNRLWYGHCSLKTRRAKPQPNSRRTIQDAQQESSRVVAEGSIGQCHFSSLHAERARSLRQIPSWPMANSRTESEQHLEPAGGAFDVTTGKIPWQTADPTAGTMDLGSVSVANRRRASRTKRAAILVIGNRRICCHQQSVGERHTFYKLATDA
jgi:hypothetical protein